MVAARTAAPARTRLKLDLVIANGENAAGGFGLTRAIAEEFFAMGVDVISTGNHWADQKEILTYIDDEDRILRPAQLSQGHAGTRRQSLSDARRAARAGDQCDGPGLHGRAGRSLRRGGRRTCTPARWAKAPTPSSSTCMPRPRREKMAMGHFCDGRASLVVGTHHHVPTADAQILPGGTAYQSRCGGLRRL